MISGLLQAACLLATECPDIYIEHECIEYIYENANISTIFPWDDYYLVQKNTNSISPLDPKWYYADWAYWTARSFNFKCDNIHSYPDWMIYSSFALLILGILIIVVLLIVRCYSVKELYYFVRSKDEEIHLKHLI